jgi:DivIVA domain-containing protein
MPLTPQDVHNKVFGPTRFRRGYDEAEVDAFLDEVEAELLRLHAEIDSLRGQVSPGSNGASGTVSASPAAAASSSHETDDGVAEAEFDGPDAGASGHPAATWEDADSFVASGAAPGTTAGEAQAAAASVRSADDTGDLEQRVARTLVLAQRAADEAVRDAELQAEQLRAAAQSEAERLRQEAAQEAERARQELERSRSEAEGDVEQLRAFEREYRTRLRAYLELQLRQLDTGGSSVEGGHATAISGNAGTADAAAAPHPAANGLPNSGLPASDPASVPPVSESGHLDLPPSVPVTEGSEYGEAGGITRDLPGEELRHEPRDLHDDL